MATPTTEGGFIIRAVHTTTKKYAGDTTLTFDFNIVPAVIFAHAMLSRVDQVQMEPPSAAIGFSQFATSDQLTPGVTVNLGLDATLWTPVIAGNFHSFTLAARVIRGDMTGAMLSLVWQ